MHRDQQHNTALAQLPLVLAIGYRSVAHYLVLTKQASAAQPAVDKPAEAGVSQPAECPVETQAESASVEPPTSKLEGICCCNDLELLISVLTVVLCWLHLIVS